MFAKKSFNLPARYLYFKKTGVSRNFDDGSKCCAWQADEGRRISSESYRCNVAGELNNYSRTDYNPRPDRGVVQLRFFADSEKTAALRAAGILGISWGKPCATFGKKWPGQVRSRSYDVVRGTTSGNFTNKSVFYHTLTWRHWCKW